MMLIMKAVNGVSVAFVYERWSCHFTFSPKFAVSSVFAWVPVEVGDRLSREKVRKETKILLPKRITRKLLCIQGSLT